MSGFADSKDRERRIDTMGEGSFPASDPPAVWTWDRRARRRREFHEVLVGADGTAASRLALSLATRLREPAGRVVAIDVAEAGAATAADALLSAVRARHADLLAIGAGSSAATLTRESPCSVLVARGDPDVEQFPRRIVVGVDGSTDATDAEAIGRWLAGSHGGQVRRLVGTGGDPIDPLWIDAELDPREPVEALLDASREADLLIVGSQGRWRLRPLGSVAERVADRATCSVLVVRSG